MNIQGCGRWGVVLCLLVWLGYGTSVGWAARLEWNPNPPEENISHYTVYAESLFGSRSWEVRDGTMLDLNDLVDLLQEVPYLLYVTATSMDGIESERSLGIPYIISATFPSITEPPASTNLAAGGELRLSVSVSSLLPVTFQWSRNGVPVPGATSREFIISNATPLNSGSYSVVVANLNGAVQSGIAAVAVQVAPQIFVQPQPAAVALGARMVLSVGAEGTQLSYQWFKDGAPLPNETNLTLTVPSVRESDAGNYSATVSNLVGTAESFVANISVWPRIEILQQPIGGSILVGGQLRLTVSAQGPEPLTYQWYRGSVSLPGATEPELILSPVDLSHSGIYSVRIRSIAQVVLTAGAQVRVVQEPGALECLLTLSRSTGNQLNISAAGPPNANFDLQFTTNLQAPNWQFLRGVATDSLGKFETTVQIGPVGSGFVRAVRR